MKKIKFKLINKGMSVACDNNPQHRNYLAL